MTQAEIMAKVASGEISPSEALKLMQPKVTIAQSEKGCVMLKGLRRFPVSLYKNEWEAVFEMQEEIKQFITDNAATLPDKNG